jgi:hypothetical protein
LIKEISRKKDGDDDLFNIGSIFEYIVQIRCNVDRFHKTREPIIFLLKNMETLFVDENISLEKSRLLLDLLYEMDNTRVFNSNGSQIIFIGISNEPWLIYETLLNRFKHKIYLQPLQGDQKVKKVIFNLFIKFIKNSGASDNDQINIICLPELESLVKNTNIVDEISSLVCKPNRVFNGHFLVKLVDFILKELKTFIDINSVNNDNGKSTLQSTPPPPPPLTKTRNKNWTTLNTKLNALQAFKKNEITKYEKKRQSILSFKLSSNNPDLVFTKDECFEFINNKTKEFLNSNIDEINSIEDHRLKIEIFDSQQKQQKEK